MDGAIASFNYFATNVPRDKGVHKGVWLNDFNNKKFIALSTYCQQLKCPHSSLPF